MGDIFDDRKASPMLIKEQREPFDSEDYLYELKFDGVRELIYLDDKVDIRNKKNVPLAQYFPELQDINKQVTGRCILDGELVVLVDGKPNFYKVLRRTVLKDQFKIELLAQKYPVSLMVFDILYYNDKELIHKSLIERKEILQSVVKENNRIIISRYFEKSGIQVFNFAKENGLEGIVAKRKDSRYYLGKRSDQWIKCKIYDSIDAVVCGYIYKPNDMTSIIIGQYDGDKLIYKGHVTLGAGIRKLKKHGYKQTFNSPFGYVPRGSEGAIWIKPEIVCVIEYMPSEKEAMRLPVFKEIIDDKLPIECQV